MLNKQITAAHSLTFISSAIRAGAAAKRCDRF